MKLIERNYYLDKLIRVIDTPDIKVITGVRRSGKSKLLEAYLQDDEAIELIASISQKEEKKAQAPLPRRQEALGPVGTGRRRRPGPRCLLHGSGPAAGAQRLQLGGVHLRRLRRLSRHHQGLRSLV